MRKLSHPTNLELKMIDQYGDTWAPFFDNLNKEHWCDGHQKYCYGVYRNERTDEKLCDACFHCLGYTADGSIYTCNRLDQS